MAGIPAQSAPQVSRVLAETTIGTGQKFPEQTESVQIASQAAATTNPSSVTVVWTTYTNVSASIGAQTAGSVVTVNTSAGVPGILNYSVLSGRQLLFAGAPQVVGHITGLVLMDLYFSGLATSGKFQSANVFPGGATYTNFIVNVIAHFYAAVATGAGSIAVHCFATLYDIPQSITTS